MSDEYSYGKSSITCLQELYLTFEKINGKKLTKEPLYVVDTTGILEGLQEAINCYDNISLSKEQVEVMREHLQHDDGLFYYIEGLDTPFRIDNYNAINICNKLLASMEAKKDD